MSPTPQHNGNYILPWLIIALDRSQPISILRFYLWGLEIGIEDYPSNILEEIQNIENWNDLSDEEQEDYRALIDGWTESQQYVLQWNREYYVSATGEIVSS